MEINEVKTFLVACPIGDGESAIASVAYMQCGKMSSCLGNNIKVTSNYYCSKAEK